MTRVDDHALFEDDVVEGQFRNTLQSSIVAEKDAGTRVSAQRELMNVDDHLFRTIVKDGDSYYQLVRGIPQGSTMSSLFCRSETLNSRALL